MQNELFEGKQRRQELVDELRSTHALRENEKIAKQVEDEARASQRHTEKTDLTHAATGASVIASITGTNIGAMLDTLSKELVRLQEERRIHAFAMMAERARRMREAEESGKRAIEQQRRLQQDEVFRQVVHVHQATVDSYLEDLILGARLASADEQGFKLILRFRLISSPLQREWRFASRPKSSIRLPMSCTSPALIRPSSERRPLSLVCPYSHKCF